MIVLVSNLADPHTDAVEAWLEHWNVSFFRFHPDEICERYIYNAGFLKLQAYVVLYDRLTGKSCDTRLVNAVWYRRPRQPKSNPESSPESIQFFIDESNACIKSFYSLIRKSYQANPIETTFVANDKLSQLSEATSLSLRIPKTIITNEPNEAYQFYLDNDKSCIVKPLVATLLNDNLKVFTHKLSDKLQLEDFKSVSAAPTLIQSFILKTSDLRITIIGEEVYACRILSQNSDVAKIDFRLEDVMYLDHLIVPINNVLKEKLLAFARKFDLKSCEFDFAELDSEEPYFLECNPNGQWLWIELTCNIPLSRSMAKLLANNSGYNIE